MPPIKTCSLSSGSSGNCIYVGCGDAHVLIDAGRSARATAALLAEIGLSPGDVSAVFITHEHSDHVGGLRVLAPRLGGPVYIAGESLDAFCPEAGDPFRGHIREFEPGEAIAAGGLFFGSFPVPHDSAANAGFVISAEGGGHKAVGIATDAGCFTREMASALRGCGIFYIESNHDADMLRRSSYPASLKRRISSRLGHLSNAQCAEALPFLADGGAREIVLFHLSEENNDPGIALGEAAAALKAAGISDGSVRVSAAPRFSPSAMMTAGEGAFAIIR